MFFAADLWALRRAFSSFDFFLFFFYDLISVFLFLFLLYWYDVILVKKKKKNCFCHFTFHLFLYVSILFGMVVNLVRIDLSSFVYLVFDLEDSNPTGMDF